MPATILSDNGVVSGTSGIKTTGSNDGQLALQTTTAGGAIVTGLSIDNNQVTTLAQPLPVASGGTGNAFFTVSGPASSAKTYTFPNENMSVGYRNIPISGSAKTSSYQLTTADVGKYIEIGSGGSITIPDATFSAGDVVSLFNNTSGNITVTCSITTAYKGGTDSDQATVTLQTRGVATILFISGTVCVINGNLA